MNARVLCIKHNLVYLEQKSCSINVGKAGLTSQNELDVRLLLVAPPESLFR